MHADWVIHNVNLATMQANAIAYGKIENGLLAVYQGKIGWLGPQQQAPKFDNARLTDGHGAWLTPGLIDCHTHLIYMVAIALRNLNGVYKGKAISKSRSKAEVLTVL